MNRSRFVLGLMAVLLIHGVLHGAVITFDDAPTGPLSDFYRMKGVSFSTILFNPATGAITPVADHAGVASSIFARSSPNVLYAVASQIDLDKSQYAILVQFVIPSGMPGAGSPGVTDRVSISLDQQVAPSDPRDDLVQLFGLSDSNVVVAVDAGFDTELKTLTIQRPYADIARAVVLFQPAPASPDVEVYDNLEYGPVVPEPPMPIPGDFDSDSDVDLEDFAHFQACFNGPNRPPANAGCEGANLEGTENDDVDLNDFGVFQNCFNGPNRPPGPNCGT